MQRKEVKMKMEIKELYLSEFTYIDNDKDVTMNIVDICNCRNEVTVAITDDGRISVQKFDLKSSDGRFYFVYGLMLDEIYIDDFAHVEE